MPSKKDKKSETKKLPRGEPCKVEGCKGKVTKSKHPTIKHIEIHECSEHGRWTVG